MAKAAPPTKPVDPATAATMKAFGKQVTAARKGARLTKEEVARRAQLAPAYIWRVEEGRQNIQLGNIGKIAWAIGVPVASLFAGVPGIEPVAAAADEKATQT